MSDIKKQYLKNIKTTKELDDSQGINALSWLWSFFKSISKYIAILVCIVVILLIVYFCCIQRNLISTVVNSVGTDTVQVFDARFNDHRSLMQQEYPTRTETIEHFQRHEENFKRSMEENLKVHEEKCKTEIELLTMALNTVHNNACRIEANCKNSDQNTNLWNTIKETNASPSDFLKYLAPVAGIASFYILRQKI